MLTLDFIRLHLSIIWYTFGKNAPSARSLVLLYMNKCTVVFSLSFFFYIDSKLFDKNPDYQVIEVAGNMTFCGSITAIGNVEEIRKRNSILVADFW